MPAYWVARAKIDDPVAYKRYTDLFPPSSRSTAATSSPAAAGIRSWKVLKPSTASS